MPDTTLPPPGDVVSLVIFDLDGVLLDFHPERRLARLAEITGLAPATIHTAIRGSSFEADAEAGAYSTGVAYLEAFNARLGTRISRAEWIAARAAAMTPRRDVLAYLDELRTRADLALLTNNGALLLEALPELAPEIVARFPGRAHASCQFGARKPDPRVYLRLLERLGASPASAAFVDDSAPNVDGAIAAGLYGIHFTGLPALRVSLDPLLAPAPHQGAPHARPR